MRDHISVVILPLPLGARPAGSSGASSMICLPTSAPPKPRPIGRREAGLNGFSTFAITPAGSPGASVGPIARQLFRRSKATLEPRWRSRLRLPTRPAPVRADCQHLAPHRPVPREKIASSCCQHWVRTSEGRHQQTDLDSVGHCGRFHLHLALRRVSHRSTGSSPPWVRSRSIALSMSV